MHEKLIEEFEMCLDFWKRQGYCEFGENSRCENCGAPYLLLKLITGKVYHEKYSVTQFRQLLDDIENQ